MLDVTTLWVSIPAIAELPAMAGRMSASAAVNIVGRSSYMSGAQLGKSLPNAGMNIRIAPQSGAMGDDAIWRILELSRFTANEKGIGAVSASEAIGLYRMERALGITTRAPLGVAEEGADAISAGMYGRIQIKGPFLKQDLSQMPLQMRTSAVRDVIDKIRTHSGADTFVVDTMGLTPEEAHLLIEALSAIDKRVIIIK
jgi:hypothetical protein